MKGLVMMALLALSFNASAEWVYIQNSEVGRFYYDPSSIKKHGRSIDVLTLFDMNGPHEARMFNLKQVPMFMTAKQRKIKL